MGRKELALWQVVVWGSAGLFCFLGIWEGAVRLGLVDAYLLPAPSRILSTIVDRRDLLFADMLVSARRVLGGFLLSAFVGVPLGLVMGVNPYVRAALNPIISVIRPLPALSWIPLSMIWLGIDESQKYMIVFMGCFASVLVYTVHATMSVDLVLQRAARNLGASPVQVVRHVVLPGALPNIMSGLKVVLAIAWTCVISAEMVGAERGLGVLIWSQKEWGGIALVFSGMICISVTVLVLDVIFRGIERFLVPWERRGTSA